MANVKVAVRARPLLPREVEMKSPVVVEMRDQSTIISKLESGVAVGEVRDASKEFVYDHSYWSVYQSDLHFASQEQIFNDLGQLVLDSAFEGYNACIFAYGQTGSGKTYTMMGSEDSPGLIPRICEGLFNGMKGKQEQQVSYKVDVSYMEIYNEKVRDLLRSPVATKFNQQGIHNLKVREHPKEGPYVENLSKHQVCNYDAIQELISIGNSQRVTAATKMNDVSSRSHAIFTILFNQAKYLMGIPSETVSKIHLVDLAGSERASQTGAEGLRLKEGGNINKSLVCLGNVISALAEKANIGQPSKGRLKYIPYRDSTLTWLLKDSLGGNSKTVMIATISPCEYSYSETISTLRYASRAKSIVNKPTVNEDPNVKIIRELRDEIRRLREIINRGDLKEVPPESSLIFAVNLHDKEEKMEKMTRDWAGRWAGLQKMIEEREVALQSDGVKMTFASEQPHLLGVDEDRFSAGVVLYYLKNGDTFIGREGGSGANDIALTADDIADRHCKIVFNDDIVCVHKIEGECYVNQNEVSEDTPTNLSHGDTLCIGSKTYFRFNNPQEAKKLRDTSMNNKSQSSNGSSIWSPLSNGSSSNLESRRLAQLQQERDALQQQQMMIEAEYEEKIRKVQEQLQSEKEGKAALEQELENLRERKLNASIRLSSSFSASTPLKGSIAPDESLFPSLLPPNLGHSSPTNSGSADSSLSFNDQFERQVPGEEQSTPASVRRSPVFEEYPLNSYKRANRNTDNIQQYSLSYCDGDFKIGEDRQTMDQVDGEVDDAYLLLETNPSHPNNSEVTNNQQNELEKIKLTAQTEKEEMKACYEERLKKEEAEKKKMQKELLDLELKLQLDRNDEIFKRRSYAFSLDSSNPKAGIKGSKSDYHIHHSMTRIQVSIPAFYLRGTGWSSYHVYELQLSVGKEKWTVYRTYNNFRDFHIEMSTRYPEISSIVFPPSKWFGYRSDAFVSSRKVLLERYIKNYFAIIVDSQSCPISESSGSKITKESVMKFHGFFRPGPLQAVAPS